MAIDIMDLRKSNSELRSTTRYFDQIQRANERLGRTQYQNILKLNNELKFTVRYFDNIYRLALKLSRLRIMPTVSLNDQASPALERLLRKLRSVKDEAINASGNYTVKQKVDVFIKGLKIPPAPAAVPSTIMINPSLLSVSNSTTNNTKAEDPKSWFDNVVEGFDNFNKIIEGPINAIDLFEKIKGFFKKDKTDESGGDSNSDRAANGNKKCCCCCGGSGSGGSNGRKGGSRNRGGGGASRRNGRRGGSSNSGGQNDRSQNNSNNRNRGNNGPGNRGGNRASFSDSLKNAGQRLGQGFSTLWGKTKNLASSGAGLGAGLLTQGKERLKNIGQSVRNGAGTGAGLLASGVNGLKNLGQKISQGVGTGLTKAKSLAQRGAGAGAGLLSSGMDGLKNIGQKVTKGLGGSLGKVTDLAKGVGKGALKGAGKIFRPLGAVMDIASIATASSGKERGAAIGSAIAGALGTLGGGLLGSIVPVAGTAVGGMAGGALLGAAGEWVGGKIGSYFDGNKTAAAVLQTNTLQSKRVNQVAAAPAAATVAANEAAPVSKNPNAAGKMQQVQMDTNQIATIVGSLKDFKTEVTNAVSVTIPAGAVQLNVKENEIDYDALSAQVGQRIMVEVRKALENLKPAPQPAK